MAGVVVAAPAFAQAPAAPPRRSPADGAHRRLGQLLQPDRAATSTPRSRSIATGSASTCRARPANADTNPALRNMFGLPDAQLRWQIGRPAGMRTRRRDRRDRRRPEGKPLEPPHAGSGRLHAHRVRARPRRTLARLKKLGRPVVTPGGAPIRLPLGTQKARIVDRQGPGRPLRRAGAARAVARDPAPPARTSSAVRVRADGRRRREVGAPLSRRARAARARAVGAFRTDAAATTALGVDGAQFASAILEVPTTGLIFELIEFKGVDRRRW